MFVFLLPEFMVLLELRFVVLFLLLILVLELLVGLVALVPEPLDPGLVTAGLLVEGILTAGRD
mgnify:CR=1 FL=1